MASGVLYESASCSLPDLRLGSVHLGFPIVQAALSGYSDWPMRLLARRHGASYAICEVLLDQFLVTVKEGRNRNKHFLHLSDEERPVGGQLMGAEPEQFAAGAKKLADAGFDVIDINFGCPVKKVLGRCRGGFHLTQPEVALDIVRRTRDAVPVDKPVTVKMRRGLDDSAQSRDNFYTILDGAFAAGVAAITVHGRTVMQRYIGPSRWSFLAEVKHYVGPERTILGSGDLFTAQDCLEMIRQTGVDGVTVARGAIGNPWIFAQCRALAAGQPLPPPTLFEQRDAMLEHFRLAQEIYGDERSGPQMRKFGIKYAALHPQHVVVREAFTKVRNLADWQTVLAQWYAEDLPGCYPDPAIHKIASCEEAA